MPDDHIQKMFSIIISENKEPPTRRSHKKSRAGCRTCKERKLKCDEAHPICGNCERRFPTLTACVYNRPLDRAGMKSLAPAPEPRSSSSASSRSGSDLDWKLPLPTSVRAELLDPFMTYPPSQVKGVDVLMKFYLKTAVYKGFPWQPASETNPTTTFYVPLILSDIVLFHATLQLSAWRLEARVLHKLGLNFAFLAAECIRLLRNRVENEDSGAGVSDQTISAVATLADIEYERGNTKMLRMHLEGLKRMVTIRGGLNSIRDTNPMVANSIFWAFAVALYEVPYPGLDPVLPPFFPDEHNLALPATEPVMSVFHDFGPAHPEQTPLNLVDIGVDPGVSVVVTSIQHVSQLIPTATAYSTASTSLTILTRMCTLLSHLLSLPDSRVLQQSNDLPYSSIITQSVRYATLLHVLTPWRGLPPDGTLTVNHILHQLIAILNMLLSNTASRSNALLLWVFSVAGVAAQIPERAWFVSHLVEMTEEMEIGNWEEIKSHLRKVIWHEALCERSHRKLWEEVLVKRKELSEGDTVDI